MMFRRTVLAIVVGFFLLGARQASAIDGAGVKGFRITITIPNSVKCQCHLGYFIARSDESVWSAIHDGEFSTVHATAESGVGMPLQITFCSLWKFRDGEGEPAASYAQTIASDALRDCCGLCFENAESSIPPQVVNTAGTVERPIFLTPNDPLHHALDEEPSCSLTDDSKKVSISVSEERCSPIGAILN